ncbi:hydrogenase nickel incorporation protein HypB [Streptomyces sp. NPDC059740]|uniref:hydrogenase nickel incorporation protein HypB n=1 Tax=Streptomyces sp. NPDC059740 TaxID=3346926 RepID=UPI003658E61A
MCRAVDLQSAVLAKNDAAAHRLRADMTRRGTTVVNLLSSPGSGKTALLEGELTLARERGVAVAALTADLATENDARRLARSGVPVRQVLTDGLCHLESAMLREHVEGWLPAGTRLLFVENVGNLVCPASYDLGESLRVALASVTEGEDKPLKYPTAFGLAHLVVVTKTDLAAAVDFDEATFRANVERINPGVEVLMTSVRAGTGVGGILDRALAAADGGQVHSPVMARLPGDLGHTHPHESHAHHHPHPPASHTAASDAFPHPAARAPHDHHSPLAPPPGEGPGQALAGGAAPSAS